MVTSNGWQKLLNDAELIIKGGGVEMERISIENRCSAATGISLLRRCLVPLLLAVTLFLPPVPAALAAGGDILDQFPLRDARSGRQIPTAAVVDGAGNTIITGYQILPGGVSEELYTVKMSSSGTVLWCGIYKVPGFSARAVALAVDQSGNVFVTANVNGANTNIITLKYEPTPSLKADGTAQESWVAAFDGGGADNAIAITVTAAQGYVYVGGSSSYGGNESVMLLKYQDNGSSATLAWQVPIAGNATTGKARAVAVSSSMVAVTGQTWNATDHFFITIVYNLAGQKIWQRQYTLAAPPQGHVYNDSGQFVRFDSKEHLVVSGTIYNDVNSDSYTAKYCTSSSAPCTGKANGDLLWEKIYNGGSDDEPNALAVDSENGFLDNVYVTGHTLSAGGVNRMFTVRYEDAVDEPVVKWQALFTPAAESNAIPASMVLDQSGSLYVAGYSEVAGNADFQTVKYRKGCTVINGLCTELWSRRFHGTADLADRAISAMMAPDGRLLVAGYADETAPLTSGIATASISTTASPVKLINSNASWTSNQWSGYYVRLTSGINSGVFRQILANDSTSLTVAYNFPNAAGGLTVASGDSFHIFDQNDLDYYLVKYDQGTLNAPNNLVATTVSNSAIHLVWADTNDINPKFRVERCTAGSSHQLASPCNFDDPSEVTVISDGETATTVTDESLDADKYYYYRVRAYTGTDYASAGQITYPTDTVHAITQITGTISPVGSYSYAGVADNDDYALSVAVGPDGHPVVSGKSFFNPGGFDYYTVKLDRVTMAKRWSQRYDDPENQADEATCVAVDRNNQIIVSGYSWLYNQSMLTDMDSIYTIKYLANATPEPETDTDLINQWSQQYNGPNSGGDDKAISIAASTDAANNVAVVGMGLHSALDLQKHDIYVLHFPPNGPGTAATPNPGYWAATPIHKGDDNQPVAVAFDPSGNVIITGMVGNGSGSDLSYDIYTAKLAASTGAILWERTYDGEHGDDMANDVTVDSAGNVYVVGFITNAQGNWDFVTLKYDENGNLQWGGAKLFDGPAGEDDEAVSIKYDPIDRNIVIAGNSLTDSGNNDVHLIRYNATDGSVVWEKRILRETTVEDMYDMTIDPSGTVYVAATTTNNANPDQASNLDIITFKVDASGRLDSDATVFGSQDWLDKPYSITANALGEVFVAGIAMNGQSNADYVVFKIAGDDIQSPQPLTTVPAYVSARLDWTDNSRSETGYEIVRRSGVCSDEPVNWNTATEIIATLSQSTLTYTDSTLTQATPYCYGVRTKNSTTSSRWVNATVTTGTPPSPDTAFMTNLYLPNVAAETGFGAKATDSSTVRLTWGVPAYPEAATGFEVWRCVDDAQNTPCSNFSFLASAPGATTSSHTDGAVCPGLTYRYQIKAIGIGWSSAFSATSRVTLPTAYNLLVDGDFESVDPDSAWYSSVGANLAGALTTLPVGVRSGGSGLMLAADNSPVTGSANWNLTAAPATATTGVKLSALGDSSTLAANGWKSKKALSGLAVNSVFQVTISRDTAVSDGSEPQLGYRDVRVYDSMSNTVLPALFVSSSSTTSAIMWFKTGSNSSGIYLYYGNPTATLTDPSLSGSQIPLILPAPSLGRKQPINVLSGGKYTIAACMKSALNKGQLQINGTALSTTVPIIDSKSGNTNYLFNKDNNWHCLSETVSSSATTVNANVYLRTYLTTSTGDSSTIATNFPDGTAYVDDLTLTPYYGLTATRFSERQIDLVWSKSSFDATGYKLERCTGSDTFCSINPAEFSQIAAVSAATGSYSDISVIPDTTYTYRLRPYKSFPQMCAGSPGWNGSGWDGAYSPINPVAAATTTNNPPSSATAKAVNTTQVNINWNDTTDTESGFELWRCMTEGCSNFSKLPVESPPFVGVGAYPAYSDSSVCSNSIFNYKVKAYNTGLSLSGGLPWTKRTPFSIVNGQDNFQTKISVPFVSGMNSNFSDLRIVDTIANREIPYWVESVSNDSIAVIWFKPLKATNAHYLYYGNTAATSPNFSGSLFFDFFDDFNGSTLGTQWTPSVAGAATLVVGGGLATLDATANSSKGNYLGISANSSPVSPYKLEARVNVASAYLGQNLIRIRGLGGIGDTGIFDVGGTKLQAYFNGAATNLQIPADQFVRWRASFVGDNSNVWSVFREDGSQIYATTYTGTPAGIYLAAGDGGGGNGKFSIDWILARKYAASEPVVTLGTPEDNGSGYSFNQLWDGSFSEFARAVTPVPVNLTADPDFENGAASWPTAVGTATGTGFDTTVGNSYSGAKSLKLTASGATFGLSQTVTVLPGASYTLSGYMKTALTAGTATCDVYGANIDSAGLTASGTTIWTAKSETVVIPVGTTSVAIRCFAASAPQGSAWMDMVQFVPLLPISSFTATRASESQVNFTWAFPTAVTDLAGFKIDRCADSACNTVLTTLTVAGAATRSSSDTGLPINSTFWYRIRAYKGEDPSCNGSKGIWETVNSEAPYSSATTSLLAPGTLALSHTLTTLCEDLRIVDSDGTYLSYYLAGKDDLLSQCNRTATKLIIKFPNVPLTSGKSVYLYYGNTLAPSRSSGGAVFDFFEDFDYADISALDSAKWDLASSNLTGFTIANSLLHGTNLTGRLVSKAPYSFGAGYTLQTKVKTQTLGYGFTPASLFSSWGSNAGLLHAAGAEYYSNNAAFTQMVTTPPAGTAQTDAMIFQIDAKSASLFAPSITDVEGSNNLTYWNPGDISQSVSARPIMIGSRADGGYNGQAYSADWEWLRVRKSATPSPSAALGSLDLSGSPYTLAQDSGSWRFRKQVTLNYSGSAVTGYQVNVVTDTTSLAVDRNALTWTDTTSDETSFIVERCEGSDCTVSSFPRPSAFPPIASKSGFGTQVSYTDRDTAAGVNYCYRVKATNPAWITATPVAGETALSNIVCQLSDDPLAPSSLVATPGTSSVALAWTDGSKNESGFKLERCQDNTNGETDCAFFSGNNTVIWLPPNDNSLTITAGYTDASVGCSGTFRYRISAWRGDSSSPDWSRGPSSLTGYYTGGTFTAAASVAIGIPASPSNVVAVRVSEQQINVSWKDNTPDESGFEVWRCTNPGCTDFAKLPVTIVAATGTGSTVTYSDNYFITPGSSYGYQIRSVITGSCAATSPPSAPNGNSEYATVSYIAPSALKITPSGTTQANLSWIDGTVAETGFAVRRCPGIAPCSGSYIDVGVTAPAAITYNDASACSNNIYNYSLAPMLSPTMPFTNSGGKVWKSRAALNVTNFKSNFITHVVIPLDQDMQADFRDIRFWDRIANVELPYFMASYSATAANVWFKSGTNSEIDLYFGNPSATSASAKDAVFGTGLLGYWPFEEATQLPTTLADVSGSGNNVTTYNFAAPDGVVATGKYGKALSLDGVNDNARNGIPPAMPIGGTLSAEAWIYPKGSSSDYNGIISWGARACNGKGAGLSISSSGVPQGVTWCNDYSAGPAVTMNAWNHIAVSFNGTTSATLYLNGQSVSGSLSGATVPNVASSFLTIGSLEASAGSRYFKGLIDEIRVYNRALTAADVAARYAATIPVVTMSAKVATGTAGSAVTGNVVIPAPENLVTNGEFESQSSSWTGYPNGSYISYPNAGAFSGLYSAKIATPLAVNSSRLIYQPLTGLVPGTSYLLKGYMNLSLPISAENIAFCYLSSWGVNWVSPSVWIPGTDTNNNNMGWVPFSVPFTIPLNNPGGDITSGNLECGVTRGAVGITATNTASFDAVQLVAEQPITLAISRASESEVRLSWNDKFIDETGFNIYRCQGVSCSFGTTPYSQVGASIVAFVDSGLMPGETYRYKVSAYKTAACPWESSSSNSVSFDTVHTSPTLTATPLNSTSVQLIWNDLAGGESGYNIERCLGSSCEPAGNELYHNITPELRPQDGLLARYSFNGTVNDTSGSGLNLASTYNYVPVYEDGGLLLSSVYNLYTPTTNILNNDRHTIEFDIKFRSLPNGAKILGFEAGGSQRTPGIWTMNNDARLHWRYDPGYLGFTSLGVSGVNGTPFSIGTWYRVISVKDGSSLKVYVNGILVSESIVPNPKTSGSGILKFGWSASGDLLIKNVSIYNTVYSGQKTVSFVDTQACPNAEYSYRVTPFNPVWPTTGGGAPVASNTAAAATLSFNSPRSLSVKAVNETQNDLLWLASTDNDQTGFKLSKCEWGNCSTSSIGNQLAYSSTGLTAEVSYCYAVASFKATTYCNGAGGDASGITSTFTTDACAITASRHPINLEAEAFGPFRIKLNWSDQSGDEEAFDVETKLWNGQWVKTARVPGTQGEGNAMQFIDTIGISPLKTYTYRVRAFREGVSSPASNEASATTPPFTKNNSNTCP